MIQLPASVRVYLCLSPCDMRRSFDGLHALVRDHLQLDVFAGHLYLFANRKKDRLKLLYWDNSGFAIWAKRLEAGTFAIPSGEPGSRRFEITVEELGALLSGIDLDQANRRQRYRRKLTS
jgi:transposase